MQSGKTANYTGLVCKAADAGYKVIIILAGLLNSLRNQTQERIDSDFMGWCTRTKTWIGASTFGDSRRPVCFTSSTEDFRKSTANSIAMQLEALNEPVVLVLKKNKSTLENLHKWLTEHNKHRLKDFSMLMIDDEADHASVNTNKEDKDPTAINKAIRNLLALFSRSSFVGYTATPFANIFIDPESEDEMQNGELYRDLFPRDFILSLDPPSNYVGPERIFVEDGDLNHCVRPVDDYQDLLPLKHKIDLHLEEMPQSLKHAIHCFILARAIRLERGQLAKHHSMMINASRFTRVQNQLRGLVTEFVKNIRQAVGNYAALSPDQALANPMIASLKESWEQEYQDAGVQWSEVQSRLKESVDPVEVISVNTSSVDKLDYSSNDFPDGRAVIAVGGLGLSRGLTLEGLLVSYFLRNSVMYDTLMQMGRWFGYRDGYDDICRIFMPAEAADWYAHIAEATEELREDFRSMQKAKMTPLEFGLKVRSHPTALMVTARNKMGTSVEVPVQISLPGRLAETSVVYSDPKILEQNRKVLENLLKAAGQHVEPKEVEGSKMGIIWKNVPAGLITAAIASFQNHPACMLTYPEPLIHFIENEYEKKGVLFDILLRFGGDEAESMDIAGFDYRPPVRTVATVTDGRIEFAKRRVASRGDEKAGLTDEEVKEVLKTHSGKSPPDKLFRKVAGRNPLFMLNFIAIRESKKTEAGSIIPTYGVSFPGETDLGRQKEGLVEYRVNLVWWKQNFASELEEEEED